MIGRRRRDAPIPERKESGAPRSHRAPFCLEARPPTTWCAHNPTMQVDSARADGLHETNLDGANRVRLPKEAALRLNVSLSMLRKLTLAGEIGHVRLGIGAKRQRFGYTDAQIESFISARSVPPASEEGATHVSPSARSSRRRATKPAPQVSTAAARLLDVALATGNATEWGAKP